MAGLLDVLRAGVKVADSVTKPLQSQITFERYTGQTAYGAHVYATPVGLHAVVEIRERQVRRQDGVLVMSRAQATILDAAALSAATGGAGIRSQDRITLPDGSQGPIIDTGGFTDAGTNIPIATEVFLGY